MRAINKILIYSLAIVVLGCLLAPLLHWAGHWAADHGIFPRLRSVPFHRYFNRAMLIAALALLYPFLRYLRVGSLADLGLRPNPHRFRDLGVGVALGIVSLSLAGLAVYLSDRVVFRPSLPWDLVGQAALTAVAVAIIEETFFRGALFGTLRRELRWPVALAFLSVFFASLHFLKPHPSAPEITEVSWWSGFAILPRVVWQFGEPRLLIGHWATLVLAGWTLGYCVVRTKSLYLAIGLHGGWVFALRSFSAITRMRGEPSIWIGRDLMTGLAAIMVVLAVLVILARLFRSQERADFIKPEGG